MGRMLKRVPLDFNWPMNVVWKGYISPYRETKCDVCEGSGLNKETKKLSDDWYTRTDGEEGWMYHLEQEEIQALINKKRLKHFLDNNKGVIPTADKFNEWARKSVFAYDNINRVICVESRAKRLGVYGKCEFCNGKGGYFCDDKYEELADYWETIEPPKGEGYQLWGNCSEGSPISPVFESLDNLCEWAEKNATTFANFKATKEEWKEMLTNNNVAHKEGNMIFM